MCGGFCFGKKKKICIICAIRGNNTIRDNYEVENWRVVKMHNYSSRECGKRRKSKNAGKKLTK